MSSATADFIIQATAKLGDSQDQLKKFGLTFGNLKQVATTVATAYAAAGAAMIAMALEAAKQEQQIERMGFAMSQAGLDAATATPAIEQFFTSLSRSSGFSDEALRESATLFTQYTASLAPTMRDITQSTELIVSIARQTGKSLPEIAMQVSNVFAGQASALGALSPGLREYGAELAGVADQGERTRLAMEALRGAFAGGSQTTLTVARDFGALKNEMGDFGQTIGRFVLESENVANALDALLNVIRTYDARLNDRNDPLAQSLAEVIELATSATDNMILFAHTVVAAYESASASAEAALAGIALLWDRSAAAQYQYEQAANRALEAADRMGQEVQYLTGDLERQVDVSIATERQLSRMYDVPLSRVQQLQSEMRDLQGEMLSFFGLVEQQTVAAPTRPSVTGAASEGPTDQDRAAKAKESITLLAEAERSAAQAAIEIERTKQVALIAAQKAGLEERLRLEEEFAGIQRGKADSELQRIKEQAEAEVAASRSAMQQIGNVAQSSLMGVISTSQAAFGALLSGTGGALDTFAQGGLQGVGQLASQLGTMLIAAGFGFAALPIPGFQSAAGAIGAGFTLLGIGSALGAASGAVGGGGGGGGGSRQPSFPTGSGRSTSFGDFAASSSRSETRTTNDFAGATFVSADSRTFGFIGNGIGREQRRGGMGAEI